MNDTTIYQNYDVKYFNDLIDTQRNFLSSSQSIKQKKKKNQINRNYFKTSIIIWPTDMGVRLPNLFEKALYSIE